MTGGSFPEWELWARDFSQLESAKRAADNKARHRISAEIYDDKGECVHAGGGKK